MNLNYEIDGVEVHQGFLNRQVVDRINVEVDGLLRTLVLNRNTLGRSTVNRYLREIKNPAAQIQECNFLDLAIDVGEILFGKNLEEYRLTKLALYIEEGNPNPLPWHRDNDPGIYTAQIYLKGGNSEQSGAFQYMISTHKLTSEFNHHLSEAEIQRHWQKRVVCFGQPGDLVNFNWYGFHSKTECLQERRTIFFEFQHNSHNAIKSDIYLPTSKISKKVISNISIFEGSACDQYRGKRVDENDNLYVPPSDIYRYFLVTVKVFVYSKTFARIKRFLSKHLVQS
jgi:hypothetical protein